MIYLLLYIYLGFLITYLVNYLPQKINTHIEQKLIFTWNNKEYHIHHWITFSIFIFIFLLGRYCSSILCIVLIGMSIGCILEDFLFDDWFVI